MLYWLSTTAPLSVCSVKICERTNWQQWKYVKTKENPSDIPTRGLRAQDIPETQLWWEGPEFLKLSPDDWPQQPHIRKTEEAAAEERTIQDICKGIILGAQRTCSWGIVERIRNKRSELRHQIRILWIVFQFLRMYLQSPRFDKNLSEVESVFIQNDQRKTFPQLMTELEEGQTPTSYPHLKPFLDGMDRIRVDTGLHPGAALEWEVKRPILLQADMPIAKAVLAHTHREVLNHQNGIEGMLAEVRRRFWIIGGKPRKL